jgi:CubicO group peptidase (beta-lactamase class C family)
MIRFAAPALLLLTAAAPPASSPAYDRAVAAGYKAAMLCSGIFNAGRTEAQIARDELNGIYPEYDAIVPTLTATVDRAHAVVAVPFDPALPPRYARWSIGEGCTTLPIGSTDSGAARTYPSQPGPAPADRRPWPLGDAGIAPAPNPTLANVTARAFDTSDAGRAKTIGVVVVHEGRIVAERYGEGFGPFTSNRTWSVGKSIAGTLVGMVAKGKVIGPETRDLIPEWRGVHDPRASITLDNLLRMASGLHSDTAGNRTDAIYFGGGSVAQDATHWPLEAPPGTRFRYANNDILLAVRALKDRLTGTGYQVLPELALTGPLGMRHTVAELDWNNDYILSSQVWSTARDLARLGQFWLRDGVWEGKRLLPVGWMKYMTTASGPQPAEGPGYGATLWLFGPKQGLPSGSYAAQGNRGQFVMVVPSEKLVVVRRGEDPGAARFDIAAFTARVIEALRSPTAAKAQPGALGARQ